ncbi:hypothetical protein J7K97_03275 [Candidatus Aerophobetes bacterium]|nr:hypothetical protein [Candidatus Aerophobetes bacterium]
MEDLIKLFFSNSLFEVGKVSLAGYPIVGYSSIHPIASSFILIVQTGNKIIHVPEVIQELAQVKTEHGGRVKTGTSFPAVAGGN